MTEIPLFPLSSALVPYGYMPLQIFEQRYLDMVAACMRTGTGFGVVWLRQGSEVSGGSHTPQMLATMALTLELPTLISCLTVCWELLFEERSGSILRRFGVIPRV